MAEDDDDDGCDAAIGSGPRSKIEEDRRNIQGAIRTHWVVKHAAVKEKNKIATVYPLLVH